MPKKYHIKRRQMKVYIPEDLFLAIREELSRETARNRPEHGDLSKLVILLLKKWVTGERATRVTQTELRSSLDELI